MQLTAFQEYAFGISIATMWLLYFITALGVSSNAPQYLSTLQSVIKIYVSLFLMYRFNIFRTVEFSNLDRRIAFSAGAFLFSTTLIGTILRTYLGDKITPP